MNNAYNFDYRCSDIAKIWLGDVTLINNKSINSEKNVLNYLHNTYKDSYCKIFLKNIKETTFNKSITHKENYEICTSVFFK